MKYKFKAGIPQWNIIIPALFLLKSKIKSINISHIAVLMTDYSGNNCSMNWIEK